MAKRGRRKAPRVEAIPKAKIKKQVNDMLESYRRQGYMDQNFVLAVQRCLFQQKLSVTTLSHKTEKCAKISYGVMQNYVMGKTYPPVHAVYLIETILGLPMGYLYMLLVRDTLNGELLDKRFLNSKKRKVKETDGQ